MTLPPSFPPPARPDLADRLLAAVAERDQPMAERLVQQWVHRRGFAALEALMAGPLLASQGAEAAQWLQQRAGAAPLGGVVPAVLQREPQSVFESVEQVVEPSVQVVEPSVEEGVDPVVERGVEQPLEPVVDPVAAVAAVRSPSWPQLAVVPDGEPAPAPRSLEQLRAWLPDADTLPLAS